jgi:hypothetical protein
MSDDKILQILIDDQISLAELASLHKAGYAVQRSPHIGNVYPANLAVGQAGIPLVLYDRTMSTVDHNYHPTSLIRNGQPHPIELTRPDNKILVPFMEYGSKDHRPANNPSAFHLMQLQKALPKTPIMTYSSYLDMHWELIGPIVRMILARNPLDAFDRYVNRYGVVFHAHRMEGRDVVFLPSKGLGGQSLRVPADQLVDQAAELHRFIYLRIDNKQEIEPVAGPLLSLQATALIDTLIESILSGKEDVYHCSGPDMYRYVTRFEGWLNKSLEYLHLLDVPVPDQIRFHVVPTADLRLVTDTDRADWLIRVLNMMNGYQEDRRERKLLFQDRNSKPDAQAVTELNRRRLQRAQNVQPWIESLDLFYQIQDGGFLSQHDLTDRSLFVPDQVAQMTMCELKTTVNQLRELNRLAAA